MSEWKHDCHQDDQMVPEECLACQYERAIRERDDALEKWQTQVAFAGEMRTLAVRNAEARDAARALLEAWLDGILYRGPGWTPRYSLPTMDEEGNCLGCGLPAPACECPTTGG